MNILNRIRNYLKPNHNRVEQRTGGYDHGQGHNPMFVVSYDGEKNPGELGAIKKYSPNHVSLRNRSYQSYMESDISQSIIDRFVEWVIGSGLRPMINPNKKILELNGVELDSEEFIDNVSALFNNFIESKESTYSNEQTLQQASSSAYKDSILGGDSLVILRVKDGRLTVDVVGGDSVYLHASSNEISKAKERGNKISKGVEIDDTGNHVAYYVNTSFGKNVRVPAYLEGTRIRTAFLLYGKKYKIKDTRGIPKTSATFESVKKLDRYKEAAIGSAEERAKVSFFIQHGKSSTGENVLAANVRNSLPLNRKIEGHESTPYDDGIKLANKIASTTGKSAYNMPVDSEIKSISSDMEFNFKDFFMTNLLPLCGATGIPIEVALQKFDSSFSASRAALKTWEHNLGISRNNFSVDFWKPIYKYWLILEEAKGIISAPKLFESVANNDWELCNAYTRIRFIGSNVPHVDPVKEVKAEREKLGESGKHISLTTVQESMERLGTGEFDNNIEMFGKEIKKVDEEIGNQNG